MKRLACLQHVEFETPGAIQAWAREHGVKITTAHLYQGDSLPDPGSFDALLVMGGPMNIYHDRDCPWLKEERAFLKKLAGEGKKKMLGICLGAQLLADALGARVLQNPAIEIGWFPIRRRPGCQTDLLPPELPVLHWHGDTFELPAGAAWLAESDLCAHQAFLFEDRILGLQFHLEIEGDTVETMCEVEEALRRPRAGIQSAAQLREGHARYGSAAREALFRMLDRFFSG